MSISVKSILVLVANQDLPLIKFLLELFFVIVVIAITAYIASKGITVLSSKLTPRLGQIGWWTVGAIASQP